MMYVGCRAMWLFDRPALLLFVVPNVLMVPVGVAVNIYLWAFFVHGFLFFAILARDFWLAAEKYDEAMREVRSR